MGLPTTANYIVVSTLMAPVVVELGGAEWPHRAADCGAFVCFYFGLMADVTPPVGLAFCGGSDRQNRPYQDRYHRIPLQHAHGDLAVPVHLQHPVADDWNHGPFHFALTVISAVVAMLVFAAATQGTFSCATVGGRPWRCCSSRSPCFAQGSGGTWCTPVPGGARRANGPADRGGPGGRQQAGVDSRHQH